MANANDLQIHSYRVSIQVQGKLPDMNGNPLNSYVISVNNYLYANKEHLKITKYVKSTIQNFKNIPIKDLKSPSLALIENLLYWLYSLIMPLLQGCPACLPSVLII